MPQTTEAIPTARLMTLMNVYNLFFQRFLKINGEIIPDHVSFRLRLPVYIFHTANQTEFRTKHMPDKRSTDNQYLSSACTERNIHNDTESVRFCTSPLGREAGGWMPEAGGGMQEARLEDSKIESLEASCIKRPASCLFQDLVSN